MYCLAIKSHVIAEDGYPVWKVWDTDNLVSPSESGLTQSKVTPWATGSISLKALDYYPYPETTIVTVNVQGSQKRACKNYSIEFNFEVRPENYALQ